MLFANSILAASGSWTAPNQNNPNVELGSMEVNGGEVYPSYYPMVGGIDDVRMYNRALTSSEVRQLFVYESQMEMNLLPGIQTGPVAFKLTALTQDLEYDLVRSGTNRTSTTTNTSSTFKSTVTNYVIDSHGILGLLTNSFNTNFPSGAKLAIAGAGQYSFDVVDATGTNIVFSIATNVLCLNIGASVNSGTAIFVQSQDAAGGKNSGGDMETSTDFATLVYNDANLPTTDGSLSSFQLSGILSEKTSGNIETGRFGRSISLKGAGGGTVRGRNEVLQGTVIATMSWTQH
jgi:hypothetical protein